MNFNLITAGIFAFLLALGGTADGQENQEDLVKKLEGQAGKPKMRSLSRSGKKAPVRRTITIKGRGIPKGIQAAEKSGNVRVKQMMPKSGDSSAQNAVPGPAEKTFVVSYDVDPASQVTRRSILFKVNSTEFADANSMIEIAKLARALRDPRLAKFLYVIEGHSSAEGSEESNRVLSQKRADVIVKKLLGLEVHPGQLIPIGHGESQAKFSETAAEDQLAQDRRVEIFRLEEVSEAASGEKRQ